MTYVQNVKQSIPAISLSTSTPQVLAGTPVALDASVTATVGSPSGEVIFLDGSTPLGSAMVLASKAELTVASLPAGIHSITANYQGAQNYAAASSTPIALTTLDFALELPSSATQQTVQAGQPATFPIMVVPSSGESLPVPALLTVTGLPPGATASVAPALWVNASVNQWTLAAGVPIPPVNLTITTQATAASLIGPSYGAPGPAPVYALLLFPLTLALRRGRRGLSGLALPRIARFASPLIVAMALLSLSGCGAGFGYARAPSQKYLITVTIVAGTLVHSTVVTLTVG